MTAAQSAAHRIVSRTDWLAARKQLLLEEKSYSRRGDQLAARRRDLPWVRVDKEYRFDGPQGTMSLDDLFQGKSQLIVQHFMFGPGWKEGCPSCSFMADHIGGALPHLARRNVSFVAVSRAPLHEIEAFRTRMGWQFTWVSSARNDFNFDYHVSFTEDELAQGEVEYNYTMQQFGSEEAPGISVFYKNEAGEVFHTYSTYARGCETMMGTYRLLDLVPEGRNEAGLPHTMAWVRHHDRYDREPVSLG
ncbi:MAG TPA: thioredoxin family protein [Gemmatimonadales bacterium]|nr:thioredoxin family protein [Gemmatimonadales bacterium]